MRTPPPTRLRAASVTRHPASASASESAPSRARGEGGGGGRPARATNHRTALLTPLLALTLLLAACSSSHTAADSQPATEPHTTDRGSPSAAPPLPTPPPVTPLPPGLTEEQALAALRARSLWLPTLPAGVPCPNSTSQPLPAPIVGDAYGEGPLYLLAVPEGDAIITVDERRAAKAIWQLAPGNEGPILVRGRELSGGAAVTFDEARTADIVFPHGGAARGPAVDAGWQDRPSLMHLPLDGCYAVQVDGPDVVWLIVFEVRFASMFQ